jgi:predicted PurR-regulated permease PerM
MLKNHEDKVMNKKYLLGLSITALILIVVASILMMSTTNFPHNIPTKIVEKRISEVQNGPDLIKKELLLDSYKRHLNFENKLMERDIAYAELIKTLSISIIFIALIQLFLVYILHKKNRVLTRTGAFP